MTPEDPNFPHEEYALLLGSTAPGSARELHSRATASKSSDDVVLADIMCDPRPSGIVLPKILRRKLNVMNKFKMNDSLINDQDSKDASSGEANKEAETAVKHMGQSLRALEEMANVSLFDRISHYDSKRLHSKSPIAQTRLNFDQVFENEKDDIRTHLPKYYETPSSYRNLDRSRIFTVNELEKKLSAANATLLDIQKQLQRGEEIYFQDTEHGNIYKGWEAFIDAKPEHIGIQDVDNIPYDEFSALAPSTMTSAQSRKIHNDSRWFSSSSYSVENGIIRRYERRKKSTKKSPAIPSRTASPILSAIRSTTPTKRRSPIPIVPASNMDVPVPTGTSAPLVEKGRPFFQRKGEPRTERSYVPMVPRSPARSSTPSSSTVSKSSDVVRGVTAADSAEQTKSSILVKSEQSEADATDETDNDENETKESPIKPKEEPGIKRDQGDDDTGSKDDSSVKLENINDSKTDAMDLDDEIEASKVGDEEEKSESKGSDESTIATKGASEEAKVTKKRSREEVEESGSAGRGTPGGDADGDNPDTDTRSSSRLRKRRKQS